MEDTYTVHLLHVKQDLLHRVDYDLFDVSWIRSQVHFLTFDGSLFWHLALVSHVMNHAPNYQLVEVLVLRLAIDYKEEEGSELGLLAHGQDSVERVICTLVVENCTSDHRESVNDTWVVLHFFPTVDPVDEAVNFSRFMQKFFNPSYHVAGMRLKIRVHALKYLS